MKLNLCIDAGNTLFKAALLNPADGSVLDNISQPADGAIPELTSFLGGRSVRAAILSTVSGRAEEVKGMVEKTGSRVVTLDGRLALPIANAYHSPDTLGPDRLALAAGAWAAYPGEDALIISAGTCITYNFITKTRTFRGGAISPGIPMRLRAMHEYTEALPLAPLEGDTRLLSYDTDSSLRSGAVLGAAAEIDGMAALFAGQYPGLKLLLTGGDAGFIQRHLQTQFLFLPHLLYQGLNAILNYHVPVVG